MQAIIGIDGGGTATRVICVSLSGETLAYHEGKGCNPFHNPNAAHDIPQTILDTLEQAGLTPSQVAHVTAGFAGLDNAKDLKWAQEHLNIPELDCPKDILNDADVAHFGAFGNKPGLLIVAGTGAITLAINESGNRIRNYDIGHYAKAAARHLAFNAIHAILVEKRCDSDTAMINELLAKLSLDEPSQLRNFFDSHKGQPLSELNREIGQLAPIITQHAEQGSPLADYACCKSVDDIAESMEILSGYFASQIIPYALTGSVARSEAISSRLEQRLKRTTTEKAFSETTPLYSPVGGAALAALCKSANPTELKRIEQMLLQCPKARFSGSS